MSEVHNAEKYAAQRKQRRFWRNIVCCIAAVVVFCTSYALILPAITMELEQLGCELDEHEHSEDCLHLVCGLDETEGHSHSDACYKERRVLTCGKDEAVAHTHGDDCWKVSNDPVCNIDAHIHDDSCRETRETRVCELDESDEHAHTADCYRIESVPACGLTEHIHEDSCYSAEPVSVCGLDESEGHEHSDDCFGPEMKLICEKPEDDPEHPHTHDDECYAPVRDLICNKEEFAAHTHTDACRESCGLEEHKHTADCAMSMEQLLGLISGIAPNSLDNDTPIDLAPYLTAVTGQGMTGSNFEYDPVEGVFKGNLDIKFTFPKEYAASDNFYLNYYLDLDGVVIPEELLNPAPATARPLYDGSIQRGTYRLIKDGDTYRIYVYIDPTISTDDSDVHGTISFSGKVKDDKLGDDGNVVVHFRDDMNITIKPEHITYPGTETVHYDMTTTKSGSYVSEDGKLYYTVMVKSRKGTPDPITLNDTLTTDGFSVGALENVSVVKGNGKWGVIVAENETEVYASDYTLNPNGSDYTLTLPALLKNTDYVQEPQQDHFNYYKITYTYPISDSLPADTDFSAHNVLNARAENKTTHEPVSSTSTADVSFSNKYSIDKTGAYWNDAINWTVTVNANNQNIAGGTLSDEFFKDAIEDSLVITPNVGYTRNDDGSITFNAVNDEGTNNNKYVITYRTAPPSTWDKTTVTNTAEFSKDGTHISDTAPVEYTPANPLTKAVESSSLTDDKLSINWTVKIKVPDSGIPAGTVISDTTNPYSWGTEIMYYDMANWNAVLQYSDGTAYSGAYTLTFVDDENAEYTLDEAKTADRQFRRFKITFTDAVTPLDGYSELQLTYPTIAVLYDTSGENEFHNSVSTGEYTVTVDEKYHPSTVVKTDGKDQLTNETVKNTDGELTWKVKASIGTLDHMGSLTITDTLPADIELTKLNIHNPQRGLYTQFTFSAANFDEKNDGSANFAVTYSAPDTDGKRKVTIVITPMDDADLCGDVYTAIFTCKVTGDSFTKGESKEFKNTVTTSTDSDGTIGSAEHTQTWEKGGSDGGEKEISKSGRWDQNDQTLYYSIEINKEGADLLEGSDTLTLVDTLRYSPAPSAYLTADRAQDLEYTLVQNSVKLYKATLVDGHLEKEQELTSGWSWVTSVIEPDYVDNPWNEIQKIITASIPDGMPLIFEYEYRLTHIVDNPQDKNINISNSAALLGESEHSTDDKFNIQWAQSETHGSISTDKSFTFIKVNADNHALVIPGAVFNVYAYDSESGWGTSSVKEYITNGNGTFQVKKTEEYAWNTLYKIIETKAPDGYLLPEVPTEYKFYFSSESDTEHTLPTGEVMHGAIDVTKLSRTEYISNQRSDTSITVNKQWFRAGNDVTAEKTGSISFDLYRKESSTPPGGDLPSASICNVNIYVCGYGTTQVLSTDTRKYIPGTVVDVSIAYPDTDSYTYYSPGYSYANTLPDNIYYAQLDYSKDDSAHRYSSSISIDRDMALYVLLNDSLSENFTVYITPSNDSVDPSDDTGVKVNETPYTISAANGWTTTVTDLPKERRDDDGNRVYYSYYIKEKNAEQYSPVYVNNDGIVSGTITVTNNLPDTPVYVLPNTGGTGTAGITACGLALTLGAALGMIFKAKQKKSRA